MKLLVRVDVVTWVDPHGTCPRTDARLSGPEMGKRKWVS